MVNMKMLKKMKRLPNDRTAGKDLGSSETGDRSLKSALGKFKRATGMVKYFMGKLENGGVPVEGVEETTGAEKKPISSRKSMNQGFSGMEQSIKPQKSTSKNPDNRSSNPSLKKSFQSGAEDSIMVLNTDEKLLKKIESMHSGTSGKSRGSRPGQASQVRNRLLESDLVSRKARQVDSSPRMANLMRSKTIISPIRKIEQPSFRGDPPPQLHIEIQNPGPQKRNTGARKASLIRSIKTSNRNSMRYGQTSLGPLAIPKNNLDMKNSGVNSPLNSGRAQSNRKIRDIKLARQRNSKDGTRLSPHTTMSSGKIEQMNFQNLQGGSGQRSYSNTDGSEPGKGGGRRLMDFGGPQGYYGDQNMINTEG
jgi:hypothetical protein